MKHSVLIGIVALIAGLGGGYLIGHFAGAPSASTFSASRSGYAGGAFAGRTSSGSSASAALTGTVASETSSAITLNTNNGSSHIVLVTPDTTVEKTVEGSLSDVTVGSTILVSGTTNSDGSVSATTIQLRPAGSTPGGSSASSTGAYSVGTGSYSGGGQ